MLLLTQNGGITKRKNSKLHIPHSTSNTCSATYENLFAKDVCKCTFNRIVYTTIYLTHEHKGTQWRGGGSYAEDHYQKVHHSYWEEFHENSTGPIHNHIPSTSCIPECMGTVQCRGHLYTFHTVDFRFSGPHMNSLGGNT